MRGEKKAGDAAPATNAVPGLSTSAIPGRFIALLIDDANLEGPDFIQARNAVLHFIAAMRPDERAAIVTTTGKGSTDFTSDRELLKKALLSLNSLGRKKFYDSVTDEKLQPCPLSPWYVSRPYHP